MIDKTVLELVDRLVATSNRAAIAESENERLKKEIAAAQKNIDDATLELNRLNALLLDIKENVQKEKESTTRSVNYWADKATKLEKELEALKEAKGDTEGS